MATEMTHAPLPMSLPDGWLPASGAVWIKVEEAAPGHWEAVIPAFTISGMGDTPHDALENAFELLHDYFLLCVRDGKTYGEAFRPMGPGVYARIGRLAAAGAARSIAGRVSKRFTWPGGPAHGQYLRVEVQRNPFGGLFPR
jgi:hypothetical protein